MKSRNLLYAALLSGMLLFPSCSSYSRTKELTDFRNQILTQRASLKERAVSSKPLEDALLFLEQHDANGDYELTADIESERVAINELAQKGNLGKSEFSTLYFQDGSERINPDSITITDYMRIISASPPSSDLKKAAELDRLFNFFNSSSLEFNSFGAIRGSHDPRLLKPLMALIQRNQRGTEFYFDAVAEVCSIRSPQSIDFLVQELNAEIKESSDLDASYFRSIHKSPNDAKSMIARTLLRISAGKTSARAVAGYILSREEYFDLDETEFASAINLMKSCPNDSKIIDALIFLLPPRCWDKYDETHSGVEDYEDAMAKKKYSRCSEFLESMDKSTVHTQLMRHLHNPKTRYAGGWLLGMSGDEQAIGPLLDVSAYPVIKMFKGRAAPHLIGRLDTHGNFEKGTVGRDYIIALGDTYDAQVEGKLLEVFKRIKNKEIPYFHEIVTSMGKVHTNALVDELIWLLDTSKNPKVAHHYLVGTRDGMFWKRAPEFGAMQAAEVLGEVGGNKALNALEGALTINFNSLMDSLWGNFFDPAAAYAAEDFAEKVISSLGKIGNATTIDHLFAISSEPLLTRDYHTRPFDQYDGKVYFVTLSPQPAINAALQIAERHHIDQSIIAGKIRQYWPKDAAQDIIKGLSE